MNISTYEARIKALEDQLNPPAPGGYTGLLSVTVSPDIKLSDETSLNAKLAAMMPIIGEQKAISESGTVGETYSITVIPGSTWKAVAVPNNSAPVIGNVGEPLTVEVQTLEDGFSAGFGAMAGDLPEEDEPPMDKSGMVNINVVKK